MKTDKKTNNIKEDAINHMKKDKRIIEPVTKLVLYNIAALLLIFVSFYLFRVGSNIVSSETLKVDYSLSGKVDYKVRLKNNEYYKDEYLKSGMQYIASLIKSIDIDFNYEAHASDKMDYKYKYNVSATTLVTAKDDKSKILFEDKEYIVKDTPAEVKDKSFAIDQLISINYDKYNDYIMNYKREYVLNSLFSLIINIHVETIGNSHVSKQPFTDTKDFQVVIPLSEQVVDISLRSPNYSMSGVLSEIENKTIKAKLVYASGIITALISVVLLVNVLLMVTFNNKKKNIYNRVIDKYLKEYDRAIVITHKSKLVEKDFDQVIEIFSIQEMLDLHDNFQLPILYYEITKNEKSYFVIIKEKILYKLVVSRKDLEKDSGDKK